MTTSTFILKRTKNPLALLLSGVLGFGAQALLFVIAYGLITDPDKLGAELSLFVILWVIICLFFLRSFLWHMRGHEVITLSDKMLTIEKKGTFMTAPSSLELDNIEAVAYCEKPSKGLRFWGVGGGNIEVSYFGNKVCFGVDIPPSPSAKIIDAIQQRL